MVLNSHSFLPGDEIIILDNEFPSNAYPYLAMERKRGSVIQVSARDLFLIHTIHMNALFNFVI